MAINKSELFNHLQLYGCKVYPFPEINNSGKIIRIINPKTGGIAFLNSPIDDTIVVQEIAYGICVRLGVPLF